MSAPPPPAACRHGIPANATCGHCFHDRVMKEFTPRTASRIDAIEIQREDLAATYAAIRRLLERTLFQDPQSSADPCARKALDGLTELRERMVLYQCAQSDAINLVMSRKREVK